MRILGAAIMLFLEADCIHFWIIYALCGVSDMLDWVLARKLHCESEAGARLDSLADILFTGACLLRTLPEMNLSRWAWIWIAVIAAIKIVNILSSIVVYRKLVFPHTNMNKATGLMLFLLTPFIFLTGQMILTAILCSVATLASIEEGHLIRTRIISL